MINPELIQYTYKEAATMSSLISAMSSTLKAAIDWINPATPKLIITFPDDLENGAPEFDVKRLQKILSGEASEMPVFIISITGLFRSGKSFLLNLMKTYLDYYIKHNGDGGWELSNMKIEGGAWAKSKKSVTHGIWMWDHPFIINGVAILLMDCQGTGDTGMSSPTLDNLILYIGLHMSNVQILNLTKNLQSSDLERLDLCADYGDGNHGEDSELSSIFDSLIFLIRDWEADEEYGEKPEEFKEIIDLAKAGSIRRYGAGIARAFAYINTFVFPHPGKKVRSSSEQDKSLGIDGVDQEFMTAAKQMFNKIFLELPKKGSQLDRSHGREVVRKFEGLKVRTVDEEMGRIRIKSGAEALEESLLNQSFVEAQQFYDNEMLRVYDITFSGKDELDDHLLGIVTKTIEMFLSKKTIQKYRDSPTEKKYLKLLEQKNDVVEDKRRYILEAQRLREEKNAYAQRVEQQQQEIEKFRNELEKKVKEEAERKEAEKQLQQKKKERVNSQYVQQRELEDKVADVTIRNKKIEREDEIRQSLTKRMAFRMKEQEEAGRAEKERLDQEKEALAETGEKLRRQNLKNVLNQEERWINKAQRSNCVVS